MNTSREGVVDAERFMERFTYAWTNRDPNGFLDAFAPDGVVYHPTMSAPKRHEEMHDYFARLFAVAPDVELRVNHWAATGDVVLIEWTMEATYGAERVGWSGADRFTLRGDRAIEGVAYFDTMRMWQLLNPSLRDLGSVEDALSTP